MKRLLISLILAVVLAAAPIQVSIMASQSAVAPAVAQACAKDEVAVGVAVSGTEKCIKGDPKNGGVIVTYLKGILQFLSAGIGIIIVLMIVIAGIQYIISAGDPANIKAAKERIINAITALILFVMGYAILSFIVPGGIY
jgi:hypothetical protein